MSAPGGSVESRFNAQWYGAALAYYGHPADFPGTFRPGAGGLELCHAASASMAGSPVWTTVNTPLPAFRRRKTHLADIAVVSTITLEGEYPPDPPRAHALALSLRNALVVRGLIATGTAIEDSGAGFHFSIPIPSLDVAALGGGVAVNEAIRRVVHTHILPVFEELAATADLTGKVGLGSYDIARILSLPGTVPGGMKEADAPWLASGYQRRWLAPHESTPPVRIESPALGYLIRLACPVVVAEQEASHFSDHTTVNFTDGQRPDPNSVADWLWQYAGKLPDDDRSTRFHRLVCAAYLKYGAPIVEEHATLLDELTGKKYGQRALREAQRSLSMAVKLGNTDPRNPPSVKFTVVHSPYNKDNHTTVNFTDGPDLPVDDPPEPLGSGEDSDTITPSVNFTGGTDTKLQGATERQYLRRIAELEAENAVLKTLGAGQDERIADLARKLETAEGLLDRVRVEAPMAAIERLEDQLAQERQAKREILDLVRDTSIKPVSRVVGVLAKEAALAYRPRGTLEQGTGPPEKRVKVFVGGLETEAGIARGSFSKYMREVVGAGHASYQIMPEDPKHEGGPPRSSAYIGPGDGVPRLPVDLRRQKARDAAAEQRAETAAKERAYQSTIEELQQALDRATEDGCPGCGAVMLPTGYHCAACGTAQNTRTLATFRGRHISPNSGHPAKKTSITNTNMLNQKKTYGKSPPKDPDHVFGSGGDEPF